MRYPPQTGQIGMRSGSRSGAGSSHSVMPGVGAVLLDGIFDSFRPKVPTRVTSAIPSLRCQLDGARLVLPAPARADEPAVPEEDDALTPSASFSPPVRVFLPIPFATGCSVSFAS